MGESRRPKESSFRAGEESALHSFVRSLAAYDGLPVERGAVDRQVFTFVAPMFGADTRITPSGLTIHWPRKPAPFRYWPRLGAGIVAALLQQAPGQSFEKPFTIEQEALAPLGLGLRGRRWFWVSRAAGVITIECRLAIPRYEPPARPEPLEPGRPVSKSFARFPEPRACPHCSAADERYRLWEGALICGKCGRSERVPPEELAGALIEPAG